MKKSIVMFAAVMATLAMASCGTSKESAYRKAYEKAQAQNQVVEQQPTQETTVVTPLVEQPANNTVTDNSDNVAVRQENLQVVNGNGLKAYSVVVGAYSVKANAEAVQKRCAAEGNDAQLAYNSERNMYRVIIGTYDSKNEAVAKRNAVASKYEGAWILYKK